jgi:hypothetical protein
VQEHKFGVIIFVPINTKRLDPFEYDPEDPFCYHCGQKLQNVPLIELGVGIKACPGPSKGSINVKVYSE